LERGLYETLITEELLGELERLREDLKSDARTLRPAEAGDRVAMHIAKIVERALGMIDDRQRVATAIELARALVDQVSEAVAKEDFGPERPVSAGDVLTQITGYRPDGSVDAIETPRTPLLDTTLLTNAPDEPGVGKQLLSEFASAERVDVIMAFIRRTGIRTLLPAIRRHASLGRTIRFLTTTYTGSTEVEALELLQEAGAEVRVSYDTSTTRLHAKAWVFHRPGGFSTAYVGSSNLTHSAQVTGLEWNVRVSGARNGDVVDKVVAVFESYWAGGDFVPFDAERFGQEARRGTASGPTTILSPLEIRPEPFQERLLECIAVARTQGHHRNLLVAATGTGKTVMAAVDYARMCRGAHRPRLLFVAHRGEILKQSLATFRQALRDPNFGELWVEGKRPTDFEHVFASIQSLSSTGLRRLDAEHFETVIVDEFHHATAPTYCALLDHVRPKELLGLTATPERSDGLNVLAYFGDRIAAELRLWDAIDQHRLSPFSYYGLHDGMDLSEVPWKRGRGYDVTELTNVLTANDMAARQVIRLLEQHVDDVHAIRALGFCVSVDHARFMARVFSEAGIASRAVWGDSPREDRRKALSDLAGGAIQVLFSVDLFNEGLDVPAVDTLLMLRPTESATLFLQQLGRGLRRTEAKVMCTVLDFVGHQHREFRFDRKLMGLLRCTRRELEEHVKGDFPLLPAGCHMELDRVSSEIVLRSIRNAIPSDLTAKVEELRRQVAAGLQPTMASYLAESGLDLEDIYAANRCWTDLCERAGLEIDSTGPYEDKLRRAIGRLLHVDDAERIDTYQKLLSSAAPPDPAQLPDSQRRLARMLVASMASREILSKDASLPEALAMLWQHPNVLREVVALLSLLKARVDHIHVPLTIHPEVPLQVHARYTRIEILAAFDVGENAKVAAWQTGVRYLPDVPTDLLAFTLDKTSGAFSPTTRYRDYAISPQLIHWESQSVVRAESDTGQRYQQHAQRGSTIMLFARLRNDDRAFWFLGPATYVDHRGEKPMAVTWHLEHALPGDLFASFAAAVA
jgi:superfamily II DNA or RNA helicase/HKD family nuclease